MTLHDDFSAGKDECADRTIWELIPWYVNGSLPDDQMTAVKTHAATCAACGAEIARQHQVAKDVATLDPFDAPRARSWETLQAQITAEGQARTPQAAPRRWFAGLNGGAFAAMGIAAVVCLGLAVQFASNPDPDTPGFVTLTSGDDAALIRFQPTPDQTRDAIETTLAAQGLTLVAGPSEAGVYTARVPDDQDPAEAATTLMADPSIAFAAADAPE